MKALQQKLDLLLNRLKKNPAWRVLDFAVRNVFFLGACLAFFLWLFIYLLTEEKPLMISEGELYERIRIGEVVLLREMPKKPTGTVCIVHRNSYFSYKNTPHVTQIRARLKSEGFSAGESDDGKNEWWALVFADDDAADVYIFDGTGLIFGLKRHIQHYAQTTNGGKLPKSFEGFLPVDCAPVAHAAIARIELNNQIYIILGEKR